jgi:hypothetical protein
MQNCVMFIEALSRDYLGQWRRNPPIRSRRPPHIGGYVMQEIHPAARYGNFTSRGSYGISDPKKQVKL